MLFSFQFLPVSVYGLPPLEGGRDQKLETERAEIQFLVLVSGTINWQTVVIVGFIFSFFQFQVALETDQKLKSARN